MEIKRDEYLNNLIIRKHNGLIKVITGIRRCGKSYLLNNIFYNHLINDGVSYAHIIRFSFDSAEDLSLIGENLIDINIEKRKVDPKKFMNYISSKIIDEGMYYLLLDEIFDGLDPVVRRLVKKILIDNVSANDMTVVIASHNLRELEELCDRICLIHKGKLLLEREIDEIKLGLRKVQVAFTEVPDDSFFEEINVINLWRNGNIFNLTIRGTEDEFMPKLEEHKPLYISAVPMTLEEIFISEMGAAGYDAENII